jgi:hypothetical protein
MFTLSYVPDKYPDSIQCNLVHMFKYLKTVKSQKRTSRERGQRKKDANKKTTIK